MDLEKLTLQVVTLAKETGNYIKNQLNKLSKTDVEQKGVHDLVTFVDKESESRLIHALSGLLPESGFIVEENQNLTRNEHYNWIIDPLDGTTNYIHGIPVYSISIALMEDDEVISGVVFEVSRNESFYAFKNGGAFLNGNRINVSSTPLLNDSLLATGFPYSDYSSIEPYLGLLKEMMKSTRGIRRLGSAAVDLAYVACGRFDVFFEYGLNSWDVAAGTLIVEEAGGTVSDFRNAKEHLFGRELVASNSVLHNEFIKRLGVHFGYR